MQFCNRKMCQIFPLSIKHQLCEICSSHFHLFSISVSWVMEFWNPTIFNIIRWVAHLMRLMVKVLFGRIENETVCCWLGHSKLFLFIFVKLWRNKKINWKDFSKEFFKKSYKNDTWSIKCLVDDSFVPLSKQTCVIYCRLTDLWGGRGQKTRKISATSFMDGP